MAGREEPALAVGNGAGERRSIDSAVRHVEIMTRSVEDLIGPLNEIEQRYAPRQLWVAGDPSIFVAGRITSVVGSCQPSPAGVRRTRRLVSELVKRDIAVLSGLALGVDTAAHTTAIRLGGRTIAVLGTPLDEVTPWSNTRLQDVIIREHVAVSQFDPGSTVKKWNFTVRNRTMALLSPATVIVEAGEGSGTRHQGWAALRLGRPLYFLESAVRSGNIRWINEQIEYGAEILTDQSCAEALDSIPSRLPIPAHRFEEIVPS